MEDKEASSRSTADSRTLDHMLVAGTCIETNDGVGVQNRAYNHQTDVCESMKTLLDFLWKMKELPT